ncbi:hypothetical protein GALMADRAFT_1358150 [Galerina marginata CBS 339.88]|uniref:Uncharacterized protein n=1 Tax=Galerina marginata (strain CBS 339.88) TaxID=685588 RepID=A0A067TCW6_GALM3|nr:hypothetical protein GALMADRAFT_1358150 [Galerina marginata CBS 339.88]
MNVGDDRYRGLSRGDPKIRVNPRCYFYLAKSFPLTNWQSRRVKFPTQNPVHGQLVHLISASQIILVLVNWNSRNSEFEYFCEAPYPIDNVFVLLIAGAMSSVIAVSKPVITKISSTILAATGTNFDLGDKFQKTKGKRILWIDLSYVKPTAPRGTDPAVYIEEMEESARRVVVRDMQGNLDERIDTVRIDVDSFPDPAPEMWQALDGLSPKHLDLRCGFDEDIQFLELNDLRHQWKRLESLSLNSFSTSHITSSDQVPRVFSRISCLELVYCGNFNFIPPGGATKLSHLRIFQNDACEMFIRIIDGNPDVAKTLKNLDIESKNSCDYEMEFDPADFRIRIQQCINLRVLRLSLGSKDGMDLDLAGFIPPSVEQLDMEVTRSFTFLRDMDDWMRRASDVAWLPNFKSFRISLDSGSAVTDLRQPDAFPGAWPEEDSETREEHPIQTIKLTPSPALSQSFDQEFEKKKKSLNNLLKARNPSVDISC